MNMPLKIAFVGNSSLTMFNFRASMLSDMKKKGYDVVVLVVIDSDIKYYNDLGVRLIPINIDRRGTNPVRDIRFIKQLKSIYAQEKFDFIFHYTIKPVIYGSMAAMFVGIPYVSVITGLGYTFIHKGFLRKTTIALYSFALRQAREVWFLNNDDKDVFLHEKIVSADKTFVLPGEGVDTMIFRPMPKRKDFFSFIFIGRVLWDKGVAEFVEAARLLKSKHPEIRFQILGSLAAENPAAVKPEEMQLWVNQGIVDYLGETRKVTSYIANCDCLVLPSYREGLSRVLLEAAAMERPIIASDITGCKEIVVDGVNGYLCNPRDVAGLAQCMEKMYNCSVEERMRMGIEGRKKIMQIFDDRIIIDLYHSKLSQFFGDQNNER